MGHVVVTLASTASEATVEVRDNGAGLPEGFDLESTSSLGLSIVRDLVATQLSGSITAERVAEGRGRWRAAARARPDGRG